MRLPLLSCLLLVGLLVSACSSTPVAKPASPLPPVSALRQGMTDVMVESVFGSPGHREPIPAERGGGERWIYSRLAQARTDQVAVATEEVPYVDPLTGQMRTVTQPVYRNQRVEIHEVLELTFRDGILVDWKRELQRGSQFSG